MSLDHTASRLGRPISGPSWTSELGAAASDRSFECVVLFSLGGIIASAALLLASSTETIAAISAALAI
jgi:hypothetical protein